MCNSRVVTAHQGFKIELIENILWLVSRLSRMMLFDDDEEWCADESGSDEDVSSYTYRIYSLKEKSVTAGAILWRKTVMLQFCIEAKPTSTR